MKFINLKHLLVLNICGVHYRCIINGISESDVVDLLQNTDLTN